MDEERKLELAREVEDGVYSDWKFDNIKELQNEFCSEIYPDEFEDYCREEFKRWEECK
jgi:hypothetical protein